MDKARLRAWWSFRQGLDGRLDGKSPVEVLAETGWARSVGGVGPYLTLFARAGTRRQAADDAVARMEIHELPSARGCTYVVPSGDFALALTVGQGFGDEAEMKTAYKLGVTDAEVDKLCDSVLKALAKQPLEPDDLREGAAGAIRHLGEEGKKKGLTSTLPLALGRLQSAGEIRRIPTNGRLDQQRYAYALWRPSPLAGFRVTREEAFTELARRYFKWIGPASPAEFQWFSGLGAKAAKTAIEPLKLVSPEPSDSRLMFPEDREALLDIMVPKRTQYALVSSLDGITHLRRDLRSLLADADLGRKVLCAKDFGGIGGLSDLYDHAILDRGRLVGLWAYDTTNESIAWQSFDIRDPALQETVQRTQQFVRSELGDARSFSLDSPKSRAPRIQALRAGSLP